MEGELFICQICKEPIHNFVCIDCLAGDIRNWLPEHLVSGFLRFNEMFLEYFHYSHDHEVNNHHLVCGARGKGSICLYCYVNEVFQWLLSQNKMLAKRFISIFSFGLKISRFGNIIKANPQPITELTERIEEFGICDECGEYSDELRRIDGKWICKECGAME